MAKKKLSKMSAKARMAYVRSFIGKKKKKRSGGKFPKGTISEWRAKANSGSAADRAKYKRAIANWDKLMSKAGFKEKWNANKIRRGGALEDGVNYRDLLNMYQNRNFGGAGIRSTFRKVKDGFKNALGLNRRVNPFMYNKPPEDMLPPQLRDLYKKRRESLLAHRNGGAIRAAGLPASLLGVKGRKYAALGGAIPVAGAGKLRGCGYKPGASIITPSVAKKFDKIFDRHMKEKMGVTKRDLYKGAGKQNSLFYTRNRMLKRQRKTPMTINPPSDEMVQLYRNLYKDSGIHPENMIDPIVRNDRLQGGNFFKKVGRAAVKTGKFIKRHKLASTAAAFIPGPWGVAARIGARALGAGLTEEAGLNGRGHPPYIYH